ncbi:hypothetical protein V1634_19235 [Plantactinospora veratri]|uniref:DUF1508 domain-containing protein n=1 Tax=Plantactinospora veratri TaxID=1436122 RepID=A0ABU7SHC3_9ACTN
MPSVGDLFIDTRGGDRTMRVSYHGDRGTVVVSLWLGTVCRGSFRMATDDVRRLIATLNEISLSAAPTVPIGTASPGSPPNATGPATVDTAPTGPDGPAASDGAAPGAAGAADPPIDETGDISGLARIVATPALRVA